jgi:hypothetical protein
VVDVSTDGNARHIHERIAIARRRERHTQTKMSNPQIIGERCSVALLLALLVIVSTPASAHNGPPFPIIENKKLGACTIALWTHPDVGTGAFYVFVETLPGGIVPSDLKIQIGVQPVSGRLPEKFYDAVRVKSHGQVQFNAQAEFDRQELWRVHLVVQTSQGGGEATAQVEVTPPGFGRWDLLLYLLPFLFVAFLWFRGVSRAKRRRNRQFAKEDRASSATKMTDHQERAN